MIAGNVHDFETGVTTAWLAVLASPGLDRKGKASMTIGATYQALLQLHVVITCLIPTSKLKLPLRYRFNVKIT